MDTTPSTRRARLRLLLLALLGSISLLVVAPTVAFASTDAPPPAADAGTTADVTWLALDASAVLWVTAFLIPLAGGLILRLGASEKIKAGLNVALNAINALVVTATTEGGNAVFSKTLVMNFLMSFAISITSLYGLYKPTGADAKLKGTGGVIGPKNPPAGG